MFTFLCSFMWRIPTVNSHLTLDQHLKQHSINTLIDTRSTLNWCSIGLLMINRWSTLDQCLLDSWQSIYQLICIDWHSIVCLQKLFDSQLTVDLDVKWMLTKYWWRCWWSVDRRLIKVIDWHELRLDRTIVRSLPVRSLQSKVRSLHSKVRSLHQYKLLRS